MQAPFEMLLGFVARPLDTKQTHRALLSLFHSIWCCAVRVVVVVFVFVFRVVAFSDACLVVTLFAASDARLLLIACLLVSDCTGPSAARL